MRRRRILVLNQYYAPAFESTAQLLTQLCEALAVDYDVTVIASAAEGTVPGRELRNGVEVLRVLATAFERSRLSLRAANYVSYFGSSLWSAVGKHSARADLVLCMSDPPFIPVLGWIAARRRRVPYIAIVQDVFPEIAVELRRLENPALVRSLDFLVRFGLGRASRVVAIGEMMRVRLVEKGIDAKRIVVIRNWVDVTELRPAPKDNPWSREHDLADKFVVMHSGNVGHAQNLDLLVRASTFLRDLDDIRFLVIGSGARQAELVELSERLDADQMVFMPYQPRSVLSQSLATGDIHFVGLASGLSGYIVPSRMNGVLSVGRPVIVAADRQSEIVSVIEDSGAGLTIEAGRADLLAAAIRSAYEDRAGLAEMGKRAREYASRELDQSQSINRYQELISELLA
jgi:colanic acid biosynthesis glycosyl transferase WcaI